MKEQATSAPAAAATIKILEFLTENPGEWGPTEIAKKLELTPNLTYRILGELQAAGYMSRSDIGRYRLTARLFSLGMKLQNQFELTRHAKPFLEKLSREAQLTAQMQIPAGPRMVLLEFIAPDIDYYTAVRPGCQIYYHGNAFGKAVMAWMNEEDIDEILSGELLQMTPDTVVDRNKIRAEFAEIRKAGIATEFNEYIQGNYCIAAPVFNVSGSVAAAVGVTGFYSLLDKNILEQLKDMVRDCAVSISRAAGAGQKSG